MHVTAESTIVLFFSFSLFIAVSDVGGAEQRFDFDFVLSINVVVAEAVMQNFRE